MKTLKWFAAATLVAGMLMSTAAVAQSAAAHTRPAQASTAQTQPAQSSDQQQWPPDQLITATVHDAWVMSGKNEQKFFQMVSELAQISAEKRGLTLPDTEAAGKRFGELVKSMAKSDHDQLLYVVVDKAVQKVGTKS